MTARRDEKIRACWLSKPEFENGDLRTLVLFVLVGVAAHELLDPTGGVDDALLASVKRVGEGADFHFDDEVVDAVDGSRFVAGHGRNARPFVVAVNEHDWIVCRMSTGLHVTKPPLRHQWEDLKLWHKSLLVTRPLGPDG